MQRNRLLIIAPLLICILFLLVAWKPLRRSMEAVVILADIAGGARSSVLKKLTNTPTRNSITWQSEGKSIGGDLYLPGGDTRARLLLIPGAAEEGKNDSRLVAFATTLARGGFIVLVPDMEGLKQLQVTSGDIQEVIDSFRQLTKISDDASAGKCGICAFSYAVGPAVLAALSPGIRHQVDVIVGVGGYYDLGQVLTYTTTGFSLEKGTWRYLPPNEYGKWLFVRSNLNRLGSRHDRDLLRLISARKMEDSAAEIASYVARLGPEGRRIFDFVANADPSRASALQLHLPYQVRREISALDLASKDLSPLKARLLLVHGVDDDIIPYPQSVALAHAVPAGQADLYLAKGLLHVDVKGGILDNWQLWRAVLALLRERDRNA